MIASRAVSPLPLVILLAVAAPPAQKWGPEDWTTPVDPPVADVIAPHVLKPPRPLIDGGPADVLLLGTFRLYQDHISPLDGPRCPMTPVCSRFAIQAVRYYGPVWGLLMTIDRLLQRENPGMGEFYPFVETGPNEYHYLDPVEDNYIFGGPIR